MLKYVKFIVLSICVVVKICCLYPNQIQRTQMNGEKWSGWQKLPGDIFQIYIESSLSDERSKYPFYSDIDMRYSYNNNIDSNVTIPHFIDQFESYICF